MSCTDAREREALRQQLLLRSLWREAPEGALRGWLRETPAREQRSLAAYRSNGEAVAGRALATAFPTVEQLVGEASFVALAAAFWRAQPPTCGDMAAYGAALPGFIAADPQLADVPYLADAARLDWAVHRAEAAADVHQPPEGLPRLGTDAPEALAMVLRPSVLLVSSRWPVAAIWHAHRSSEADRFSRVRAALEAGTGEHALVWREGWRPRVLALADADAAFTTALLAARPLALALDAAGAEFQFEPWLLQALQHGWLAAVLPCLEFSGEEER
ncbi:putative DNA-binding domain-containing protein [Aquincola sp. S2]|uniref:DNA-binding domain-containing protein n=1 Tax=Pseudaquabacterium terrae TaxID=2732868 RepID=A0ABX2EPS5_9BURK|nr:DNA-binding domain-containing protein [Aquabacterium terrae]NRF70655.1 putative DNA-binding domain-containing protein [Aquabacterium terrae]